MTESHKTSSLEANSAPAKPLSPKEKDRKIPESVFYPLKKRRRGREEERPRYAVATVHQHTLKSEATADQERDLIRSATELI